MANEGHLKILKQGVAVWNRWREDNRGIKPELSEVDLSEINLNGVNLGHASLIGAILQGVKFEGASLRWTNLTGAWLRAANLTRADLTSADLTYADLLDTNLSACTMQWTKLMNIDLSTVKGLEMIEHRGPSWIGIETVYRSHCNIPRAFLRGAGVPEAFIFDMCRLTGDEFSYYSCFISYSSKDQEFVERLHADLQARGVRCWFAPEDLRIGDKLRSSFDEAIRIHDKLMVLLSENLVNSAWVEKEVETAFEKERQRNKTVLFPIRLDDAVIETTQAWAADIRRTRHIGDFCDWKNADSYKKAFDGLLRDLRAKDKAEAVGQV